MGRYKGERGVIMADEYTTYDGGLGLYQITLDNIADIEKVAENFEKINNKVGNIDSITLEGAEEQIEFKSVEAFLKFIWSRIKNLDLTDLMLTVTTQNNEKLNVVLKALMDKDSELQSSIDLLDLAIKGLNSKYSNINTSVTTMNNKLTDTTNKTNTVSTNLDAAKNQMVKNALETQHLSIWTGTKAEYDAISTKDSSVLYVIV